VHKFQWSNQTGPGAYVNPGATVQILNGAAGCPENTDPWQNVSLPFSAYRIAAYGYGRITIHNATHATWSFIEDLTGNVIDSIDIVQNNHGPFALTASGKQFEPSSDPAVIQKAYEEAQQHIERQKKQVMMEVAAKKEQAGSSKKKTSNKHKTRLGGGGRHKKAE
jgi:Iron/zinc purple acid phosphatase-like protein C